MRYVQPGKTIPAKHADCNSECQQAVAYGVWPEHSCSPECAWLKNSPDQLAAQWEGNAEVLPMVEPDALRLIGGL